MSNTLRVIISDAVTGGDDNVTETIVPGTGTYTKSASDNMANQTILPIVLITMTIIISFAVVYVVLSRIIKKKNEKKASKQPKFKTPDFAIKKIKKAGYEALVLALLLGTGGLLINHSARIEQAKAIGLSITTEDTTITVERSGDSAFAMASATVTINEATNRGYALYVKAVNDANLKLVSGTEQINALALQNDLANLALNTYGITTDGNATDETVAWDSILKLDDATNAYHILTKNSATEANDTATVYFGAYVDTTLPAGTYEGEIEYVATDRPDRSLEQAFIESGKTRHNGYFAMQDMTSKICEGTELEESSLQVIDTRDDRVYTIAKLKDGKCWMTQNMDIAGGTALYSDDSDVPEGYERANGVPYYTLPESNLEGFNDATVAYVYNTPYDQADRTTCGESHPCYSYYSWLATTVGGRDSDGVLVSSEGHDAAYSICPKGWKLPTAGGWGDTPVDSDFHGLAESYDTIIPYNGPYAPFLTNAGAQTVANFHYTGYIDGRYEEAFKDGTMTFYYASSTGFENMFNSYSLYSRNVSSVNVFPTARLLGTPVRCLAR
ncbi:hypothetical protein IJH23_02795 [Candidatus Saccharibacteria bacterium]|nr:hypothetical protein [Candidatus Saccharibacteria bacterium]